jgi:hypothetical protein
MRDRMLLARPSLTHPAALGPFPRPIHALPAALPTPRLLSIHPTPFRSRPASSRTSIPFLIEDGNNEIYDWGNTTAFEGSRVNELRKKQREPSKLPDAATLFSRFKERPGTFILIALFGVLTIGDFIFNVSRAFICLLPDMCAPASY